MLPHHGHAPRLGPLLMIVGVALSACERERPPAAKPTPSWVAKTEITPHETRRVFDDNVELSVSITNRDSAPVKIDRMDRDRAVLLVTDEGRKSGLHPVSLGMTKPIVLAPNERLETSLLFQRVAGEPQTLEIYQQRAALTRKPGSFQAGKPASK